MAVLKCTVLLHAELEQTWFLYTENEELLSECIIGFLDSLEKVIEASLAGECLPKRGRWAFDDFELNPQLLRTL